MKLFTRSLLLLFVLLSFSSKAQDTIVVQTFTYDSITSRRGVWQFPEGESFRKILMYYNLKCDIATTHDHYACGEWDYLTYTKFYDHTGVYDSTLCSHPNFTFINNQTADSILLRTTPAYSFYQSNYYSILYNDTTSLEQFQIFDGNSISKEVFSSDSTDGRSQFIYTANELSTSNMTAGKISGMKFHIATAGSDLQKCMVRLANCSETIVSGQTLMMDMDTVFYGPVEIGSAEWLTINFTNAFEWDGVSNILVDVSFNNNETGIYTEVFGSLVYDKTLDLSHHSAGTDYALNFDGEMDFLDAKDDKYFNSDFTFEVWLNKKSDNNWSRVFDFGNGANKNNIIIALSKSTSGKLSFHVNTESANRSFELDDPLPKNEWTHLTLKLMYERQGHVFLNGELVKIGLLAPPEDTVRTRNFIGKSNWENDTYADMIIDEFRLYNYSRDNEEIALDPFRTIANPTEEEGLVAYYTFDTPDVPEITDKSGNACHAECFGLPSWYKIPGNDLKMDFEKSAFRPEVIFERLESDNYQFVTTMITDSIADSKVQIVYFDEENPTIPTDTIETYLGGYRYVYNDNQIVDFINYPGYETIIKVDYPYYEEPFEIINPYEIGRFITPYGINLDLGNEGFTWVYDVTDYADLLQGDVDISAGNQQELIDIKFLMIKGTPPRDVLKMQRPWGKMRSYYYKDLSDDSKLSDIAIDLLPETEGVKITSRLTGHGHNSNTGNYPHCCEWKDNTHYILANGTRVANWHIFQYTECAMNPVYPQGGTWLGAREGWCPGDKVKDFSFDLSDYIIGNKINIDYDITKVPDNNAGMGWGNYVIAMHLFEYGEQNNSLDAELYDVINPNSIRYYSRKNPICSTPKVIIRNNGTETLTSVNIEYSVSGGETYTYKWTGELLTNREETVELPVRSDQFWLGDGKHVFTAKVVSPNGQEDQYADNDVYNSEFNIPDLINSPIILKMRMNKRPEDFALSIVDLKGNVVFSRDEFESETIYQDTLNLENGCYTLILTDDELTGLSYWAWGAQGSGYLRMYNDEGDILKNFEAEFGGELRYCFSKGSALYIDKPNLDNILDIYPNPTKGLINIDINGISGSAVLKVIDMMGKEVINKTIELSISKSHLQLDLTNQPKGSYIVYIIHPDIKLKEIIVKD
ncbi:MAG: LamG-like jellyroll fold domain-containing protein [Bacteroidota bacterium]|nr:LamG-like jellyroll fold domain-containing protein [Bacteroidota bacterium]